MSDMAKATVNEVRTRHIAVDEYYRMAEVGILRPEERVELLNGRIVEMPPIGPRHSYSVMALNALLARVLGDRAVISVQGPLRLDRFSEPQPDIIVARGPLSRYGAVHPASSDAVLLIEVAETSLSYDEREKLSSYARAGVAEYWIVNLVRDHLAVYRDPEGDRYRSSRIIRRGERVAPAAFPDDELLVDAILPPPAAS